MCAGFFGGAVMKLYASVRRGKSVSLAVFVTVRVVNSAMVTFG